MYIAPPPDSQLQHYDYDIIMSFLYTVGVKSMSPVGIGLLFVILYNIPALHHNTNGFSIEIK